MDQHAPPTDDPVIGTHTTDKGETRPATLAGLDAFVNEINRSQRARKRYVTLLTRHRMLQRIRRCERRSSSTTRSTHSTRTTTSRRAQTSASATSDPSPSSRARLSANAFGTLRTETRRRWRKRTLIRGAR